MANGRAVESSRIYWKSGGNSDLLSSLSFPRDPLSSETFDCGMQGEEIGVQVLELCLQ